MAYDINGRYVPGSRLITSLVTLNEAGPITASTKAGLKALPADFRFDGLQAVVAADRTRWIFNAASTASDAADVLIMTPSDSPTAGRWMRAERAVHLKLPIDFNTADAAVLYTVPVGYRLYLERLFWEVTADWTGGSSSTIGVSSSQSPYNTKGDLLGATAGSAAAALTAAAIICPGVAIGTDFGSNGVIVLDAGATLRHDRITSAFTAGTGFVHVLARTIA